MVWPWYSCKVSDPFVSIRHLVRRSPPNVSAMSSNSSNASWSIHPLIRSLLWALCLGFLEVHEGLSQPGFVVSARVPGSVGRRRVRRGYEDGEATILATTNAAGT